MTDAATVTIRPATTADAPRLAALLTDEGYPAGETDLVARIERFSTPDSHVLVAEAAGEVVGFIAFHLVPRFETDERFARIVALVVEPGVRERGVGKRLMADAERIAKDAGAAFLEVTSGHHRPEARKLFESLRYAAGGAAYLRKRPRGRPRARWSRGTCESAPEEDRGRDAGGRRRFRAPSTSRMTFPRLRLRDEVATL